MTLTMTGFHFGGTYMKKSALLTSALLLVSSSYAMAAPINQMANHETAIGVGTKESYIEHKVTNKATAGFQYADRDEKGDHKDAYLQYEIIGSCRLITSAAADD